MFLADIQIGNLAQLQHATKPDHLTSVRNLVAPESSFINSMNNFTLNLGMTFGALPSGLQIASVIAFGLVVGSFLNVVIHRLPIMIERAWLADFGAATGQSIEENNLLSRYNLWFPRSACPHCNHMLSAWENIPLLSYLILRGRCSQCATRLSLRYPAIELTSAICAVATLVTFGATGIALSAFGLCAALLAMSAIDIDTHMLPDSMTLPLLWAGLTINFGGTFVTLQDALLGAIAGYLTLWCVYWLFKLWRGIEGIGYGDFKLLAALGAWLGWTALPKIILISAVTGTVAGLLTAWRGRMRFDEPLPFGPFLAVGGMTTLFFSTPIVRILGG